MLEGAGIGSKQQGTLIGQCLTVMEASHAHLLPFLLQGLCPHEIHQYLGAMQSSSKEENSKILERVLQVMSLASEEYEGLKKLVQERVTALAAMT